MITLSFNSDPSRLEVSMSDDVIEGYIVKTVNGWDAYRDSQMVGKHTNPVEAGKLVIRNFNDRARVVVEQAITQIETNLRETTSPAILTAKERMVASLRTKLTEGVF